MSRLDLFHGIRVGAATINPAQSRWRPAAPVDGDSERPPRCWSRGRGPFRGRARRARRALRRCGPPLQRRAGPEAGDGAGRARRPGPRPTCRCWARCARAASCARWWWPRFPARSRHLVITFSAPRAASRRWRRCSPRASTASEPTPRSAAAPRTVAWAALALVGSLLAASIGLWRRADHSSSDCGGAQHLGPAHRGDRPLALLVQGVRAPGAGAALDVEPDVDRAAHRSFEARTGAARRRSSRPWARTTSSSRGRWCSPSPGPSPLRGTRSWSGCPCRCPPSGRP